MLLLPEDYLAIPFEDHSSLVDNPSGLRERAADLGYVFFKNLVPKRLVDPVRAWVREVSASHGWVEPDPANPPMLVAKPGIRLAGQGWDDPRWVELNRCLQLNKDFQALANDEHILSPLKILEGEPMALATANHCWLKLPGSPEFTTLPHQDIFYLPQCPRMWTVWLPLVNTPLDVGPLGVVPGSHKKGLWPHDNAKVSIRVSHDITWATEAVCAGDVLIFCAGAVHCAWSNVSATLARLSLDIRYEPSQLPTPSVLRPDAKIVLNPASE